MRTLATLATAGTYGAAGGGELLVGRKVANTAFVRALLAHSGFERFVFLVGESREAEGLRELVGDGDGRVGVANLLELPRLLARGEVDVLHHGSHLDRYLDLVWTRDRHATRTVPVTGQIHTLSYPRSMNDYLRALLLPPRRCDAIFCSSEGGRRVLREAFASLGEALAARGVAFDGLACELPVVPLGVDADALARGSGAELRRELEIAAEARVVLCLARFTEYDKMDLFPLLLALRSVLERTRRRGVEAVLLLAGARQGTRTPEMLKLWARALGIAGSVRFLVDFPEARKADVLAAADAFTSPCDNPQETFGITVVEALAAGLPVVVSDFDGYRETVTDDVGVRVPTRWRGAGTELDDLGPLLYERPLHLLLGQGVEVDLERLADGLAGLLVDDARRATLARAARERARAYDWSVLVPRYEAVWRELAARPMGERVGGPHPLALDYARVFGHYPTVAGSRAERVLEPTAFGRALGDAGQLPLIHPELAHVLDAGAASAALAEASEGLSAGELAARARERSPERPYWHADCLVAWLVKQGVLRERER